MECNHERDSSLQVPDDSSIHLGRRTGHPVCCTGYRAGRHATQGVAPAHQLPATCPLQAMQRRVPGTQERGVHALLRQFQGHTLAGVVRQEAQHYPYRCQPTRKGEFGLVPSKNLCLNIYSPFGGCNFFIKSLCSLSI